MAIKLFGFSIGKEEKETSKDELPKKSLSFVAPDEDDGAIPLEVGGYFGTAVDFDGAIKTDLDLIKKYRDMAIHPEVESAIADICNESIVYNDTFTTVKIDMWTDESITTSLLMKATRRRVFLKFVLLIPQRFVRFVRSTRSPCHSSLPLVFK